MAQNIFITYDAILPNTLLFLILFYIEIFFKENSFKFSPCVKCIN